jgi:hypothetical protein
MQPLSVDAQWVKLGEGDEHWPTFALNVRMLGGMIVGRVLRADNVTRFGAEVYRFGRWRAIGSNYDSFDEAVQEISKAP